MESLLLFLPIFLIPLAAPAQIRPTRAKLNDRALHNIKLLLTELAESFGNETLIMSANFEVKEVQEEDEPEVYLEYTISYADDLKLVRFPNVEMDRATTIGGRISLEKE